MGSDPISCPAMKCFEMFLVPSGVASASAGPCGLSSGERHCRIDQNLAEREACFRVSSCLITLLCAFALFAAAAARADGPPTHLGRRGASGEVLSTHLADGSWTHAFKFSNCKHRGNGAN